MDSRAKQRLTGAVILVAVFVLFVPELLTGPRTSAPADSASKRSAHVTASSRTATSCTPTRTCDPARRIVPVITASTSSARPAAAGASGCAAKRAMDVVGRTRVWRNWPRRVISASARPRPRLSSLATGLRNVNGSTASDRTSRRWPSSDVPVVAEAGRTSTGAVKR